MTQTIYEYLEELLEQEQLEDGMISIEFLSKKHQIMLSYSIEIENEEKLLNIDDGVLIFSNYIILYNETKGSEDDEAVINYPYIDKKGMTKSVLKSIVDTLSESINVAREYYNQYLEMIERLNSLEEMSESDFISAFQSMTDEEKKMAADIVGDEEIIFSLPWEKEYFDERRIYYNELVENQEFVPAPKY
ncbi:MAG: DUF3013 family protein [Streptococcaceae bacterium]|nr:DUF3013 family protein [Streptococcaceae bacterium]